MPRPLVHSSMELLHRSTRAAVERVGGLLLRAHRRKVSRQSGFALVVVTVTVALLGAVVNDFGFNARVDFEAAANARDQLRAEYLARSGINLSRILIKVQSSVIDKINQGMGALGGGSGDFQIADFAPYLLSAFGGAEDERAAMGDFLGVDAKSMKGFGLGKGGSFEVQLGTEDGKVNVNCGGGPPPQFAGSVGQQQQIQQQVQQNPFGIAMQLQPPSKALFSMLMAMQYPQRYNRIFEALAADGQYYTRDDVTRAIIDWSDNDEQRYDPLAPTGMGNAGEDYRYDADRDPYKAHNHYFDTVEELNLVRGVGDDWFNAFSPMLTVYGGCKVNVRAIGQDNWPIMSSLVRTAADQKTDPAILLDENIVSMLVQQTLSLMILFQSGTGTLAELVKWFGNGAAPGQVKTAPGQAAPPPVSLPFPGLPGVTLNLASFGQIAKVKPRRVYRIESTGTLKRAGDKKIQVRIRAIWDTVHYNQTYPPKDPSSAQGAWLYWRVE